MISVGVSDGKSEFNRYRALFTPMPVLVRCRMILRCGQNWGIALLPQAMKATGLPAVRYLAPICKGRGRCALIAMALMRIWCVSMSRAVMSITPLMSCSAKNT